MMTTAASARRIPRGFEHEGTQLPFFSRYVFGQDVANSELKESVSDYAPPSRN